MCSVDRHSGCQLGDVLLAGVLEDGDALGGSCGGVCILVLLGTVSELRGSRPASVRASARAEGQATPARRRQRRAKARALSMAVTTGHRRQWAVVHLHVRVILPVQ